MSSLGKSISFSKSFITSDWLNEDWLNRTFQALFASNARLIFSHKKARHKLQSRQRITSLLMIASYKIQHFLEYCKPKGKGHIHSLYEFSILRRVSTISHTPFTSTCDFHTRMTTFQFYKIRHSNTNLSLPHVTHCTRDGFVLMWRDKVRDLCRSDVSKLPLTTRFELW